MALPGNQRKTTFTIAAALVVAVVALGCGGSEEDSGARPSGGDASDLTEDDQGEAQDRPAGGGSSQDATTASFKRKARAVCARQRAMMNGRAAAVLRQAGDEEVPARLTRKLFNRAVQPGLEAEVRELRALDAPDPRLAEGLGDLFQAIGATLDRIEADPAAFAVTERPFARSEAIASRYGLRGCGGP